MGLHQNMYLVSFECHRINKSSKGGAIPLPKNPGDWRVLQIKYSSFIPTNFIGVMHIWTQFNTISPLHGMERWHWNEVGSQGQSLKAVSLPLDQSGIVARTHSTRVDNHMPSGKVPPPTEWNCVHNPLDLGGVALNSRLTIFLNHF